MKVFNKWVLIKEGGSNINIKSESTFQFSGLLLQTKSNCIYIALIHKKMYLMTFNMWSRPRPYSLRQSPHLFCFQASSPWWSSLSSASWCLWSATCSVIKDPTTPMRPREQNQQTALMRRSSSMTQPSLKPLMRARRSGSSEPLSAAWTHDVRMYVVLEA